jgi:hypothetical protein
VSATDVDRAVAEASRAITELGACGIQLYTPLAGQPLDGPAFAPLFKALLPISISRNQCLRPQSSPFSTASTRSGLCVEGQKVLAWGGTCWAP